VNDPFLQEDSSSVSVEAVKQKHCRIQDKIIEEFLNGAGI
jgi:hypothetical protein